MLIRDFPLTSHGKHDHRQQLAKRSVKIKQWMKNKGRSGWKYNDVRISLNFTNKAVN